jgi:SHS2 domain-containing protein
LFEHTADLGLEIFGADPQALFVNAGRALFEVLVPLEGQLPENCHLQRVEAQGADWADLMVNWLRELLYLFNGHQQVVIAIDLAYLAENALRATVTTTDFDPDRYRVEFEIKAVTYHQVIVAPCENGWRARVIFDV